MAEKKKEPRSLSKEVMSGKMGAKPKKFLEGVRGKGKPKKKKK